MITLFRPEKIYQLKDVKSIMREHICSLPDKISTIGAHPKILRFELACESVDVLTWLHNQRIETKIYWSDRDQFFEIGGVGIADRIMGKNCIDHKNLFSYFEDRLSEDNSYLRYYGGITFDDSNLGGEWETFGTHQFIVPQFELLRLEEKNIFAFNIAIDDIQTKKIDSVLATLEQFNFSCSLYACCGFGWRHQKYSPYNK